VELDARHTEEVTPDIACEHGVPIADDGRREPVEAYDALKKARATEAAV
jgi:hypothetical protein